MAIAALLAAIRGLLHRFRLRCLSITSFTQDEIADNK
jgi:hypothetical protein